MSSLCELISAMQKKKSYGNIHHGIDEREMKTTFDRQKNLRIWKRKFRQRMSELC